MNMARLLPGLVLMLVGCTESTVPADTEEADAPVSDGVDAETVWDGGQRFSGTRPDMLDLLIVTEEDAMFSGPLRAGIPWLTRALGASGIDVRLGVNFPNVPKTPAFSVVTTRDFVVAFRYW